MTEKSSKNITIHPATKSDIPVIAALHIKGWQGAYGGIVDQACLDSLSVQERQKQWEEWLDPAARPVLIARDDSGHAAGFVSFGKLQTPPPGSSPIRPLYSGEIYALYLLPDYYRQGIGTSLLRAAASGLTPLKHRSLCLWVAEKNVRAVSFYKKMGGERCGKKDVCIGSSPVREVCFGWRDTTLLIR